MTEKEKIELIADILDCEENKIIKTTLLSECDDWDSIAVLSFIAVIDEHFNRMLTANEIKKFKTIGDLIDAME